MMHHTWPNKHIESQGNGCKLYMKMCELMCNGVQNGSPSHLVHQTRPVLKAQRDSVPENILVLSENNFHFQRGVQTQIQSYLV